MTLSLFMRPDSNKNRSTLFFGLRLSEEVSSMCVFVLSPVPRLLVGTYLTSSPLGVQTYCQCMFVVSLHVGYPMQFRVQSQHAGLQVFDRVHVEFAQDVYHAVAVIG